VAGKNRIGGEPHIEEQGRLSNSLPPRRTSRDGECIGPGLCPEQCAGHRCSSAGFALQPFSVGEPPLRSRDQNSAGRLIQKTPASLNQARSPVLRRVEWPGAVDPACRAIVGPAGARSGSAMAVGISYEKTLCRHFRGHYAVLLHANEQGASDRISMMVPGRKPRE